MNISVYKYVTIIKIEISMYIQLIILVNIHGVCHEYVTF